MTINPKVWQFPELPIETQLFHVPGAAYDGGMTSGGAQFITPEPGGFATLEIEPSLAAYEWVNPAASWLMSKTNGQILRIRLSRSPQIAWSRRRLDKLDYNMQRPECGYGVDAEAPFASSALKGSNQISVNLDAFGKIIRPGHVIGHAFETYLVDEVSYTGNIATVTVTPPFRRNITSGQPCLLTPWFTGRIVAGDFRVPYNSVGHVKLGNITMFEAVVP